MIRRAKATIFAALLALSVALVAGGALAHELDHALHKHDLPCALHLYAGHADGIASPGVVLAAVPLPVMRVAAATVRPIAHRPIFRYAVRGPPRFL